MENLLQVKLKLEEQAKIAYGNARMILNKEEDKLQALYQKKQRYQEEQRQLRQSRLDLVKMKHAQEATEIVEEQIKIQQTVVRNAEQRLEVARIRLNHSMTERKTQERLKEKAWEKYIQDFEAEERKEVDELVSFQFSNPSLFEEGI